MDRRRKRRPRNRIERNDSNILTRRGRRKTQEEKLIRKPKWYKWRQKKKTGNRKRRNRNRKK